jgi:cobalt/nickel transport system permease protein
MVSAVFFVVSLIPIPMGVTSVHLVLNGLVGLLLGWVAFPAILIALLLQAVLFGHGGLLALGVNTLAMALPAVVVHYLFHRLSGSRNAAFAFSAGFGAGSVAVLGSAFLVAGALWSAGEAFELAAKAVFGFHLAVAVVEGLVTGSRRVPAPSAAGTAAACPARIDVGPEPMANAIDGSAARDASPAESMKGSGLGHRSADAFDRQRVVFLAGRRCQQFADTDRGARLGVGRGGLDRGVCARRLEAVDPGQRLCVAAADPIAVQRRRDAPVSMGPMVFAQEGLLLAVQIGLKANAIVLGVLVLLAGLEIATLGHALGHLGFRRN